MISCADFLTTIREYRLHSAPWTEEELDTFLLNALTQKWMRADILMMVPHYVSFSPKVFAHYTQHLTPTLSDTAFQLWWHQFSKNHHDTFFQHLEQQPQWIHQHQHIIRKNSLLKPLFLHDISHGLPLIQDAYTFDHMVFKLTQTEWKKVIQYYVNHPDDFITLCQLPFFMQTQHTQSIPAWRDCLQEMTFYHLGHMMQLRDCSLFRHWADKESFLNWNQWLWSPSQTKGNQQFHYMTMFKHLLSRGNNAILRASYFFHRHADLLRSIEGQHGWDTTLSPSKIENHHLWNYALYILHVHPERLEPWHSKMYTSPYVQSCAERQRPKHLAWVHSVNTLILAAIGYTKKDIALLDPLLTVMDLSLETKDLQVLQTILSQYSLATIHSDDKLYTTEVSLLFD